MSHPDSSLPDAWVERIWTTMRGFYGAAFDRQWECPEGIDPVQHVADLKAVWGRELRGFQQNPRAIAHGLDHLPERPPNLPEFAALCRRVPEPAQKALPAPKVDASFVASVLGAIKRPEAKDPKAWARALRDDEARGVSLTIAQKAAWRTALSVEAGFGVEEPQP
jgi:hypothetical protein